VLAPVDDETEGAEHLDYGSVHSHDLLPVTR
jgi:hypothetical protein